MSMIITRCPQTSREVATGIDTDPDTFHLLPNDALSTNRDPATLFPPGGGVTKGASAIKKANRDESGAFGRSGKSSFEVLQMEVDRDLAFWTAFSAQMWSSAAGCCR